MTPSEEWGISRVMQSLGRCYVQYINKTYRRTGTLWEGRHKSSLVDADRYLLACYRYIELNPVRANMVHQPGEYLWSSFRANALGDANKLLTPHALYLSLGDTKQTRLTAYQALFENELDKGLMSNIRKALSFSMLLGDSRFEQQIEEALGRKVGLARRGRPQKIKCK